MHPQLELLLELQDLKSQRRSLASEDLKAVEAEVFDLQPDEALRLLDAKIDELAQSLDGPVRDRFLEVSDTVGRAVAPVIGGICYGCFIAIPTAWSSEVGRNDRINICDHCGRFLYYLD